MEAKMTEYLMPGKVSRQDGSSGYIITLTYTQTADGGCEMRCEGDESGMSTLLVCDRDGRYTEHTDYGTNGSIWRKRVNEYGGDGRQTGGITYDGDGRVTERSVFSYGAAGKLTEHSVYNGDGGMVFRCIFEQGGRYRIHTSFGKDGTALGERREDYDEDGRLLKRTNGSKGHLEEFFYHADGKRIESAFHAPDGKVTVRTLYTYDQNGNPTETVTRGADGTVLHRSICAYEELPEGGWLLTGQTHLFGDRSVESRCKLLEVCFVPLTAGQAKSFRAYYEEVLMD